MPHSAALNNITIFCASWSSGGHVYILNCPPWCAEQQKKNARADEILWNQQHCTFFWAIQLFVTIYNFSAPKNIYFININPYNLKHVLEIAFLFRTWCIRCNFVSIYHHYILCNDSWKSQIAFCIICLSNDILINLNLLLYTKHH